MKCIRCKRSMAVYGRVCAPCFETEYERMWRPVMSVDCRERGPNPKHQAIVDEGDLPRAVERWPELSVDRVIR